MQTANFVKVTLLSGIRNRLASSKLVPIIPAGTRLFGLLNAEYQDRYDVRITDQSEPLIVMKEVATLDAMPYENWDSLKLQQRMAASDAFQGIYKLKQEGKLGLARALCEQAIVEYSAAEDIADSEMVKLVQADLGDILLQQEQFATAIPHLEAAARFFENQALSGSDRSGIWTAIFSWIGIARSWLALGQTTEAVQAVNRLLSLERFAKTKRAGGKIDLLLDIAELCLETGQIVEARSVVAQADKMFKKYFAGYLSIEGTNAAKRAAVLQDRLVAAKRNVSDPSRERVINFLVRTDSHGDAETLMDYLLRIGGNTITVTKRIRPSSGTSGHDSKPRFVIRMKLTVNRELE